MSDINDFLNHDTGKAKHSKVLRGWTKDGSITVWLHTKYPPKPIYRYKLPIPFTYTDKTKVEKTEVWTKYFVTHDPETVHKSMYARNQAGQREVPPSDPFGVLLEEIYQAVMSRRLHPMTTVWSVTDGAGATTNLTAAGICGLLQGNKIPDFIQTAASAHGLLMSRAWQESSNAKLFYVFAVVNDAKPADGVQLAVETSLLGDKVKGAIHHARESFGAALANPLVTPYAFRWKYYKDKMPIEKYDAIPIGSGVVPLRDDIKELIFSEPPDDRDEVTPYNVAHLRSYVEAYMPKQVQAMFDLDRIFKVKAEKPTFNKKAADDFGGEQQTSNRVDVPAKPAQKPPQQAQSVELVACDSCGQAMPETAAVCPHCGYVYEQAAPPPPPPPPQPIRKRSEMKAQAHQTQLPTVRNDEPNTTLADGDDFPF